MLIFGRPSTGAAVDLAKATDIARAVVMRYGMHRELGLVVYEEERRNLLPGTPLTPAERRYSEATAREIDIALREAVKRAVETASDVLARGRRCSREEQNWCWRRRRLWTGICTPRAASRTRRVPRPAGPLS